MTSASSSTSPKPTLAMLSEADRVALMARMPAWVSAGEVVLHGLRLTYAMGHDGMSFDELAELVTINDPDPIQVKASVRDPLAAFTVIGVFPSGAMRTVGELRPGPNGTAEIVPFGFMSLMDPDDNSMDEDSFTGKFDLVVDLIACKVTAGTDCELA